MQLPPCQVNDRQMYINDRKPYRGRFINVAVANIGKEALPNRLNTLNELTIDWLNEQISDNAIRVLDCN